MNAGTGVRTPGAPASAAGRSRFPSRRHVVLGAAGLLVGSGVWLAVTGFMARGELERVRAGLASVRVQATTDPAAARATAEALAPRTARARRLTSGPVWTLAAHVPVLGAPVRSVQGITEVSADLGTQAVPALLEALDAVDLTTLRGADGTVDLARVAAAGPALERTSASLTRAGAAVAALPRRTWLPAVDDARAELAGQLRSTAEVVDSAAGATHLLPALLGGTGPKTYLVAFQNNAEARGTGGLPGAFALLRADRGRLSLDRLSRERTLADIPADVDLGADYDELYHGAGTTTLYGNANMSPHFPYAARIWSSMWQRYSGQGVDGVIALDPAVLGYILAATGPATAGDGTVVSAANVVELTQSTAYTRFPADDGARRAFLLEVAGAAMTRIMDSAGSLPGMVRALDRAAEERRLLVWSADPALEAALEPTRLSGVIPETDAPYAGLSIVNDGGNKLDYYLDRALTWLRDCRSPRDVAVTVALTNGAPAHGLPRSTVTARSDVHGHRVRPGDNRLLVGYFATAGAKLRSVTVDGRAATAGVGAERGHPVFTVDLELPRGTTRTVVLHLTEPQASGAPVVLRQPLVRPLAVDVHDAC